MDIWFHLRCLDTAWTLWTTRPGCASLWDRTCTHLLVVRCTCQMDTRLSCARFAEPLPLPWNIWKSNTGNCTHSLRYTCFVQRITTDAIDKFNFAMIGFAELGPLVMQGCSDRGLPDYDSWPVTRARWCQRSGVYHQLSQPSPIWLGRFDITEIMFMLTQHNNKLLMHVFGYSNIFALTCIKLAVTQNTN